MSNLDIYNNVRKVPDTALKEIQAGRLKGKSDINPMWRIKALTEQFGPVGIGWKYVITEKRLENGGNGEIAAFVDINLYYKYNGEWSEAIPGTGGSSFVSNERNNGLYTSDECFKMALTDAISVACKALGVGADVYWDKDKTKYTSEPKQDLKPLMNKTQREEIVKLALDKNVDLRSKGPEWTGKQSSAEWTVEDYTTVKAKLQHVDTPYKPEQYFGS